MSRIGKNPVPIPAGVEVQVDGGHVKVKGPLGELERTFPTDITVTKADSEIVVTRPSDSKLHKSLHGLVRTLVSNMVVGVSTGYTKELEIVGVGYRASMKGQDLEVLAGYSHPVAVKCPAGIAFELPHQTKIIVKGADKEVVGETAAKIRAIRKPEPYKGKGIRYVDEYVRRKVGKTAK